MMARQPPPLGQPDDHLEQQTTSRDFAAWRARLAALPRDRTPVVLVACGSFNPPTRAHLRLFSAGAAAVDGGSGASGGLPAVVVGGLLSPVADAYAKAGLAPAAHRLAMCALAARHGADEEIGGGRDAADAAAPAQQRRQQPPVDVGVHCWEATRGAYTRTLDVLRHISRELNSSAASTGGDGGGGGGDDGGGGGGGGGPTSTTTAATPTGAPLPTRPVRVMLLGGTDLLESMRRPGVWSEPEVLLREHGVVCVERTAQGAAAAPPSPTPPATTASGAVDEALLASCVVHAAVCTDEDAMADVSSSRAREALRAARNDAAAATSPPADEGRARLAGAADPRVAALLDPRVAEYAAVNGLY